MGRSPASSRDLDVELGQVDSFAETPAGALQDIAIKCGTKVHTFLYLLSWGYDWMLLEVL